MVRPTARASATLSIIASSLAALGVVAAGVQIGESDLGADPRRPSAMLSRPAAQVVVQPAPPAEQELAAQLLVTSAATARPATIPVSAPVPQSVPAPGPSEDAAPPAPADPAPAPSPVPVPIPGEPQGPVDTVVDPLVTLLEGLLGSDSAATTDTADAQEAGTEAPTSLLSGLLGR